MVVSMVFNEFNGTTYGFLLFLADFPYPMTVAGQAEEIRHTGHRLG